MLTAMCKQKQIFAQLVEKADAPFTCPECMAPVQLKKGRIKVAHFAHYPPVICRYGLGEGETHRQAKLAIYKALEGNARVTDLRVEYSLGQVRPDISFLLDGVNRVAVEVQASALRPDEITRRSDIYKGLDYAVIWLPPLAEKMKHGEVYRPRDWEKTIHAMQYGKVYYWAGEEMVLPVQFIQREEYVESKEWYDQDGEQQSSSGYNKFYANDRILAFHSPVAITSMSAIVTSAFKTKKFDLPSLKLWLGPKLPKAPKSASAPVKLFKDEYL